MLIKNRQLKLTSRHFAVVLLVHFICMTFIATVPWEKIRQSLTTSSLPLLRAIQVFSQLSNLITINRPSNLTATKETHIWCKTRLSLSILWAKNNRFPTQIPTFRHPGGYSQKTWMRRGGEGCALLFKTLTMFMIILRIFPTLFMIVAEGRVTLNITYEGLFF